MFLSKKLFNLFYIWRHDSEPNDVIQKSITSKIAIDIPVYNKPAVDNAATDWQRDIYKTVIDSPAI